MNSIERKKPFTFEDLSRKKKICQVGGKKGSERNCFFIPKLPYVLWNISFPMAVYLLKYSNGSLELLDQDRCQPTE